MPDTNTYAWFVKHGNIKIWLEDDAIRLTADHEGRDACELTRQDALEFASILHHLIRELDRAHDA